MFEKYFDEHKKEYQQIIRGLLEKLEQKYETLWKELLEDLQTKKITMDNEIATLEKTLVEKREEELKLASEILDLKKGIKREKESLEAISAKKEAKVEEYLELEKKITAIVDREQEVQKKENELKEKEMEIKARQIDLEEKQRTYKRIIEKINL